MPPGIGYPPYGRGGSPSRSFNFGGGPVGTMSGVFGDSPRPFGADDLNRMFTEMALTAVQEAFANNLLYNPAVNPTLNPFPSEIPGNWATTRGAMDRQLEDAIPAGPTQIDQLLGSENASSLLQALGLGDMLPTTPSEPAAPAGGGTFLLAPFFEMLGQHMPQSSEPSRPTYDPSAGPGLGSAQTNDLIRRLLGG